MKKKGTLSGAFAIDKIENLELRIEFVSRPHHGIRGVLQRRFQTGGAQLLHAAIRECDVAHLVVGVNRPSRIGSRKLTRCSTSSESLGHGITSGGGRTQRGGCANILVTVEDLLRISFARVIADEEAYTVSAEVTSGSSASAKRTKVRGRR